MSTPTATLTPDGAAPGPLAQPGFVCVWPSPQYAVPEFDPLASPADEQDFRQQPPAPIFTLFTSMRKISVMLEKHPDAQPVCLLQCVPLPEAGIEGERGGLGVQEHHNDIALQVANKSAQQVLGRLGFLEPGRPLLVVCCALNTHVAGLSPEQNAERSMQAVPSALQKLFAAGLLISRSTNFARPFAIECMNARINSAYQPERALLAYHQLAACLREFKKQLRPATLLQPIDTFESAGSIVTVREAIPAAQLDGILAARCSNPACQSRNNHVWRALKACAHCSSVHYCDRACQTAHWPEHRRECGLMRLGRNFAKARTLPQLVDEFGRPFNQPAEPEPERALTVTIQLPEFFQQ